MSVTRISNRSNPPGNPQNRRLASASEVDAMFDELENQGITTQAATIGTLTVSGVTTFSDTTDSTDKDTGSVIFEGGIGIELNASLGGNLNLTGNLVFDREVNHSILIPTSSTANTAGGNLTISSGKGLGSGDGGSASFTSAQGGATGNGGQVILSTGAGGATSGNSGSMIIQTGTASNGLAGSIQIVPGTHTSSTAAAVISLEKGVVRKPVSTSVASGGSITAVELIGGLITATGATGNWQLPTAAQLVTALGGTVTAGTNFEFVFNANGMTATNTATLVVGVGMTVASAPAITGGDTLTVTQDTQVTAGFRVVFNTTAACKIYRIW